VGVERASAELVVGELVVTSDVGTVVTGTFVDAVTREVAATSGIG